MEVNKLYKPIIRDIVNCEHKVRVCSVKLPTLKNGIVDIKTLPNLNYFTRYVTRIMNSDNYELASYEYDHNYFNNRIDGLYLEVNSIENRQNGSRLGELLRLISIIEMLENKFDSIKLFSKDSAIFFHSKYGFKANVEDLSSQINFLRTIAEDDNDLMHEVNQKAKKMLNRILNEIVPVKNSKYTKEINAIINEYIHLAQNTEKPYKKHGFNKGMYMDLTKQNVLSQKDFFNNLLKKHNIDYTI